MQLLQAAYTIEERAKRKEKRRRFTISTIVSISQDTIQ